MDQIFFTGRVPVPVLAMTQMGQGTTENVWNFGRCSHQMPGMVLSLRAGRAVAEGKIAEVDAGKPVVGEGEEGRASIPMANPVFDELHDRIRSGQ